MKSRKHIILLLLALLLLGAVTAAGAGWLLLHGTPSWYRLAIAPQQEPGAAERVENKLIHLFNRLAALHARRVSQPSAFAPSRAAVTQSPALYPPEQPFSISFTDTELNAFFAKWGDAGDRRASMDSYLQNPRLLLRNGEMVLAATVPNWGTVVSVSLQPQIDAAGNLQLNLMRAYVGILPLPDALWTSQRRHIEQMLRSKLPFYQAQAALAPDGTTNPAATAAGMNELVLAMLQRQPAAPVIFLPYDATRLGRSIPVHVDAVEISNGTLTLSVREMTAAQRAGLLEHLRGYGDDTDAR